MKKRTLLFILLILTLSSIKAQENKTRAESMAAIAIGKEAEGGTLDEVSAIFSEAVKISPDYAELYMTWSYMIMQYAEKEKNLNLFDSCYEKLEKAIEIKPDYPEAYSFWGICLAYCAHEKKDDNLFHQSFDKFKKAIELDSDYSDGYLSWGKTLLDYARQKKNNPIYYQECIQKYDKALQYNTELLDAYSGRGYAYLCLGRLEKDLPKYRQQLEASYLKAEQLGSQSAAYNLACYYSLIKEKDEAVKWLEKTIVKSYNIRMDVLTKDRIEKDDDFKNIRRDKKYKEIMHRYFEK